MRVAPKVMRKCKILPSCQRCQDFFLDFFRFSAERAGRLSDWSNAPNTVWVLIHGQSSFPCTAAVVMDIGSFELPSYNEELFVTRAWTASGEPARAQVELPEAADNAPPRAAWPVDLVTDLGPSLPEVPHLGAVTRSLALNQDMRGPGASQALYFSDASGSNTAFGMDLQANVPDACFPGTEPSRANPIGTVVFSPASQQEAADLFDQTWQTYDLLGPLPFEEDVFAPAVS
jgi:hypothetical protein